MVTRSRNRQGVGNPSRPARSLAPLWVAKTSSEWGEGVARGTMGDSIAARRRVKGLSIAGARAGRASGWAFSDLCT